MRILLWTGEKHSGKSTTVADTIEFLPFACLTYAGLLAPSRYENDELCGFDAVDIATGDRAPLLESIETWETGDVGNFVFCDEGLQLGETALRRAIDGEYDFVLVDEFGPLELKGGGWRPQVDELVKLDGVLMLVVRDKLVEQVAEIYDVAAEDVLSAFDGDSIVHTLEACGEVIESRETLECGVLVRFWQGAGAVGWATCRRGFSSASRIVVSFGTLLMRCTKAAWRKFSSSPTIRHR